MTLWHYMKTCQTSHIISITTTLAHIPHNDSHFILN